MHEAHENEQNFQTSGSNSPPLSNAPPLYQMPHHMEDLERQIPYSLENFKLSKSNSRGYARGGGF